MKYGNKIINKKSRQNKFIKYILMILINDINKRY